MKIDDKVIRNLQAGDMEALHVIYEATADKVFGTALGLLGNRPDAEDAAHDVFLRVYRYAGSFDFRSAFSTWLYRLTVNHCLNVLRRRRVIGWLRLDKVVAPGGREIEKAAAQDEVRRALARLDPRCRGLLVLRELQGLSYREIAAAMALPVGTVRSGLSRAREKLRAVLEKE